MTDLLLILLIPMMRLLSDPKRYWYYAVPAAVGFVADILMNNFTIPIFTDKAWFEEWTFSTRLERLTGPDTPMDADKLFYIAIALRVNRAAGFAHIKNAAQYELQLKTPT